MSSFQFYSFYSHLKIPVDMITRCVDSPNSNCERCENTPEHDLRVANASNCDVIVQVLVPDGGSLETLATNGLMYKFIDKYWRQLVVPNPLADARVELHDFNCIRLDDKNPVRLLRDEVTLKVTADMTDRIQAMRVLRNDLDDIYDPKRPLLIMPDFAIMISGEEQQ